MLIASTSLPVQVPLQHQLSALGLPNWAPIHWEIDFGIENGIEIEIGIDVIF